MASKRRTSGNYDQRSRVEVFSSAKDPGRFGVGSSAVVGDVSATGILVPSTPTQPTVAIIDTVPTIIRSAQQNRYLFREAAKFIPAGHKATLIGIREAVTIGYDPGKVTQRVGLLDAAPARKMPEARLREVAGNIIEGARVGMKGAASLLRRIGQKMGATNPFPFGPTQLPDWVDPDALCAATYNVLGFDPFGPLIPNAYSFPFELLVTSPFWTFPDANVSRHLRVTPPGGQQSVRPILGDIPPPGGITIWDGTEPGLLYVPPYLAGYVPPNDGKPPLSALGGMDTWRDNNRYPWSSHGMAADVDYTVEGPCTISLWVSVFQTDPCSRIDLTKVIDEDVLPASILSSIGPENMFLLMFPLARYYRVAGSLNIDVYPRKSRSMCDPERKGKGKRKRASSPDSSVETKTGAPE